MHEHMWPTNPFAAHKAAQKRKRVDEAVAECVARCTLGDGLASSAGDMARVLAGIGLQRVDHTRAHRRFLQKYLSVMRLEFGMEHSLHVSVDKGSVGGRKWMFSVAQVCKSDGTTLAAVLPPQACRHSHSTEPLYGNSVGPRYGNFFL